MTDTFATRHVFKFFIETCRHMPFGTVTIRTKDTEVPHFYNAKYRAEKAVARRYGKPKPCALCGEPQLEVHAEPFSERYPFPQFALEESVKLHSRKAPVGLRNRNASVFRVVTCTGGLIGFVTVLKKGTLRETEERAERTMVRRYGKPRSCGQCGDTSHELRQVSGPGVFR